MADSRTGMRYKKDKSVTSFSTRKKGITQKSKKYIDILMFMWFSWVKGFFKVKTKKNH